MGKLFLRQFAARAPVGDLDYFLNRAHADAEEILNGDDAPKPKALPAASRFDWGGLVNNVATAAMPFVDRFGGPLAAKPPALPKPPPPKTTSPWVYVGIGVGGLALVGLVAALVKKK